MVTRREFLLALFVLLSVTVCDGNLLNSVKVKKIQQGLSNITQAAKYILEEIQIWDDFKKMYNKTYPNALVEENAILKFLINLGEIQEHNLKYDLGLVTFSRALWQFSDMSAEEVNIFINGFIRRVEAKAVKKNSDDYEEYAKNLPTSVNWVDEGYVTPVLNQEKCGSCWSFSAIGAIEGQYFKKTGKLLKFSQQNLIDCNYDQEDGNYGCKGGDMTVAYDFLIEQKGISLASKYPYKAADSFNCSYRKSQSRGQVVSYETLESGDEDLLKVALAKHGPIAIAVDASLSSFQSYKFGVFYDKKCSLNVNHAVLLVGYGRDIKTKKDYWLVKNSYGAKWGERGYIKIARNENNHCGISEFAIIPNCE